MGIGFGERLRDACVTVDVIGVEELTRRCARLDPSITEEVVRNWLATNGETMLLRHALIVRNLTGIRGEYLLDGIGSIGSLQNRPLIARLAALLEHVPPDKLRRLLRAARRMAEGA